MTSLPRAAKARPMLPVPLKSSRILGIFLLLAIFCLVLSEHCGSEGCYSLAYSIGSMSHGNASLEQVNAFLDTSKDFLCLRRLNHFLTRKYFSIHQADEFQKALTSKPQDLCVDWSA